MIPSACLLWMYYSNSLAKENIRHLWSFWLSLKMKKLCLVSVLKEYLRRTEEIRGEENKLLLSYQAPHKPVSKNTQTCKAYLVRCSIVRDLAEARNSCGLVQSHPLHPLTLFKGMLFRAGGRILLSFRDITLVYIIWL